MTPENEEAARELNSETASVRPAGNGRSLLLDLGADGERGGAPAVPTALEIAIARIIDPEATKPHSDWIAHYTAQALSAGYDETNRGIRDLAGAKMIETRPARRAAIEKARAILAILPAPAEARQIVQKPYVGITVEDEVDAPVSQAERIAELERALKEIAWAPKGRSGPALPECIRIARAALASAQSSTTEASHD